MKTKDRKTERKSERERDNEQTTEKKNESKSTPVLLNCLYKMFLIHTFIENSLRYLKTIKY